MEIGIYIVIYLLGSLKSYFLYKKLTQLANDKWTKGERNMALFFSVFSWMAIAAELLIIWIIKQSNNREDAKW